MTNLERTGIEKLQVDYKLLPLMCYHIVGFFRYLNSTNASFSDFSRIAKLNSSDPMLPAKCCV